MYIKTKNKYVDPMGIEPILRLHKSRVRNRYTIGPFVRALNPIYIGIDIFISFLQVKPVTVQPLS